MYIDSVIYLYIQILLIFVLFQPSFYIIYMVSEKFEDAWSNTTKDTCSGKEILLWGMQEGKGTNRSHSNPREIDKEICASNV